MSAGVVHECRSCPWMQELPISAGVVHECRSCPWVQELSMSALIFHPRIFFSPGTKTGLLNLYKQCFSNIFCPMRSFHHMSECHSHPFSKTVWLSKIIFTNNNHIILQKFQFVNLRSLPTLKSPLFENPCYTECKSVECFPRIWIPLRHEQSRV